MKKWKIQQTHSFIGPWKSRSRGSRAGFTTCSCQDARGYVPSSSFCSLCVFNLPKQKFLNVKKSISPTSALEKSRYRGWADTRNANSHLTASLHYYCCTLYSHFLHLLRSIGFKRKSFMSCQNNLFCMFSAPTSLSGSLNLQSNTFSPNYCHLLSKHVHTIAIHLFDWKWKYVHFKYRSQRRRVDTGNAFLLFVAHTDCLPKFVLFKPDRRPTYIRIPTNFVMHSPHYSL